MTQRRRPAADNRRRAGTGQTVNIEERRRSAGTPSGSKRVIRGSGSSRSANNRTVSRRNAYGNGNNRTGMVSRQSTYSEGNSRPGNNRAAPSRNSYGTGNNRTGTQSRRRVYGVENNRSGDSRATSRRNTYGGKSRQRERPQADVRPHAKKKVKKRRRIPWKAILTAVLVVVCIGGLGYLETIIFQTKKVEIVGNTYTPTADIETWLNQDKYYGNSLYLLWKYNRENAEYPPSIENMKISMKSPQEIRVNVTEKTFAGRIDYAGAYLYFDKDGTACLKSEEAIEGVPYVEGMEIEEDKVLLGEAVPVSDSEVFGRINEACALLTENELVPDQISCSGTDLTLHFGVVRVQIGSSNYADRIAQISPVLTKLNELYNGQTGTLHLENYDSGDSSIRFVPDTQ